VERPAEENADLARERRGRSIRIANLAESTSRRKRESRDKLISAAVRTFRAHGYYDASVEDIIKTAGVGRITFYRHFRSKADLLSEIHRQGLARAVPGFLEIRDLDFRDQAEVEKWLARQFDVHRADRQILLAYGQAAKAEREFVERAQELFASLIEALGASIPAFAVRPDAGPEARFRWHEAWLLLYEILDQSNQAAFELGIAGTDDVIRILARRFVDFVERHPEPDPG
jgi:AcrR family transcriptional regulator